MFIKLNTYTLYVNFNKHNLFVAYLTYKFYQKREYVIIPIISIGGCLKLNRNQFVYNTTD